MNTVKKHSHCFNEQGRHFNGRKQDLARAIFAVKYPKKRDFLHQKVENQPLQPYGLLRVVNRMIHTKTYTNWVLGLPLPVI